jgi:two-component system chemotaxis response regulator CheY
MKYSILLVEDSKTTRALIRSTIEGMDSISFIETESGFDALKILTKQKVDLIITDINMPDINGLELINFIKKNPLYSNIPLIIISTEGSEKDKEKGLSLGAEEYVVKPFNPEYLQKVVRKHLK